MKVLRFYANMIDFSALGVDWIKTYDRADRYVHCTGTICQRIGQFCMSFTKLSSDFTVGSENRQLFAGYYARLSFVFFTFKI